MTATLVVAAGACGPGTATTAPIDGSPGASATAPAGASPGASAVLDRVLSDSDAERARRDELVDTAIVRVVSNERVIEAMRSVPRHSFVPTDQLGRAYEDFALPIEHGQTISQPSLVALMTALLEIEPGERVLEIGTGSGYQAAILRELTDQVYSVEIIPGLHETAGAVLDGLGYGDIELDRRDGYFGWPEHAPFDAIVVTAAADHLPSPLVDQLAPDGRMVIPIGPPGDIQTLWLVTVEDGEATMQRLLEVMFVPLTRQAP